MKELSEAPQISAFARIVNTFWFGLACGILLPVGTLFAIYYFMTTTMSLDEFFAILKGWNLGTHIYIWSVIPLFFTFAFFYYKKYDNAMRGIILLTLIYTIFLVIVNF